MTRPNRNIPAAIGLLFVAPLVAEFLLGDLTLTMLPALVVLAPMYGGGALLIRESVRRAGRGWPSIFLLGAAYALVEEGFADQSLFNPDYLRLHLHFLSHGWIPALGIGAWWTLFMLNLHAFWSIGVSIALVEALTGHRAKTPWLGRIGEAVVAAVFVIGLYAVFSFNLKREHFWASRAQFVSTGAVAAGLIALSFVLPRPGASRVSGGVPGAWITGLGAFVLGVAVLLMPPGWDWGAAGAMLGIDGIFLVLLAWLSGREGWRPIHTLSVGAGGAMAYGVHAFFATPVAGGGGVLARVSNAVFLAGAAALIAAGARRTSRTDENEDPPS